MSASSDEAATKQPAAASKDGRRRGPGKPFRPGQSGNPAGRARDDLGALIRSKDELPGVLLEFWLAVMRNEAPGFVGQAEVKDAQRASECLAARGWGKERESLEVTGAEGERLTVVVQTLAEPKGEA